MYNINKRDSLFDLHNILPLLPFSRLDATVILLSIINAWPPTRMIMVELTRARNCETRSSVLAAPGPDGSLTPALSTKVAELEAQVQHNLASSADSFRQLEYVFEKENLNLLAYLQPTTRLALLPYLAATGVMNHIRHMAQSQWKLTLQDVDQELGGRVVRSTRFFELLRLFCVHATGGESGRICADTSAVDMSHQISKHEALRCIRQKAEERLGKGQKRTLMRRVRACTPEDVSQAALSFGIKIKPASLKAELKRKASIKDVDSERINEPRKELRTEVGKAKLHRNKLKETRRSKTNDEKTALNKTALDKTNSRKTGSKSARSDETDLDETVLNETTLSPTRSFKTTLDLTALNQTPPNITIRRKRRPSDALLNHHEEFHPSKRQRDNDKANVRLPLQLFAQNNSPRIRSNKTTLSGNLQVLSPISACTEFSTDINIQHDVQPDDNGEVNDESHHTSPTIEIGRCPIIPLADAASDDYDWDQKGARTLPIEQSSSNGYPLVDVMSDEADWEQDYHVSFQSTPHQPLGATDLSDNHSSTDGSPLGYAMSNGTGLDEEFRISFHASPDRLLDATSSLPKLPPPSQDQSVRAPSPPGKVTPKNVALAKYAPNTFAHLGQQLGDVDAKIPTRTLPPPPPCRHSALPPRALSPFASASESAKVTPKVPMCPRDATIKSNANATKNGNATSIRMPIGASALPITRHDPLTSDSGRHNMIQSAESDLLARFSGSQWLSDTCIDSVLQPLCKSRCQLLYIYDADDIQDWDAWCRARRSHRRHTMQTKVLVPVVLRNHWVLLLVDFDLCCVHLFNSLHSYHVGNVKAMVKAVLQWVGVAQGDISNWAFVDRIDVSIVLNSVPGTKQTDPECLVGLPATERK